MFSSVDITILDRIVRDMLRKSLVNKHFLARHANAFISAGKWKKELFARYAKNSLVRKT